MTPLKTLRKRVAICLDTCHVFAAGYPLHPKKSLDETIRQFDKTIGLARLKVIHANGLQNASKESRVDRHEGIGQGAIGRAAFKLLVTHPKLKTVPFILETPKEGDDGKPDPQNDIRNLKTTPPPRKLNLKHTSKFSMVTYLQLPSEGETARRRLQHLADYQPVLVLLSTRYSTILRSSSEIIKDRYEPPGPSQKT